MKILNYSAYSRSNDMIEFLIKNLESPINESNEDLSIKNILKGLSKDLKFNIGLVFTFGTGITFMIPIVQNLIKNGKIKVDPSKENLILLCLTILAILYLESVKNKSGESEIECPKCSSKGCKNCKNGKIKSEVSRSDAQTLLEELKMRGFGNGLVKKFVDAFRSISNFIKSLFSNSKYPIKGLLEMFGYAALLIPVMNTINSLIGKYEMDIDSMKGNLLSLGLSVASLATKNSIEFLLNKLKNKINLKDPIKDGSKDMDNVESINEQ